MYEYPSTEKMSLRMKCLRWLTCFFSPWRLEILSSSKKLTSNPLPISTYTWRATKRKFLGMQGRGQSLFSHIVYFSPIVFRHLIDVIWTCIRYLMYVLWCVFLWTLYPTSQKCGIGYINILEHRRKHVSEWTDLRINKQCHKILSHSLLMAFCSMIWLSVGSQSHACHSDGIHRYSADKSLKHPRTAFRKSINSSQSATLKEYSYLARSLDSGFSFFHHHQLFLRLSSSILQYYRLRRVEWPLIRVTPVPLSVVNMCFLARILIALTLDNLRQRPFRILRTFIRYY